MIRANCGVIRNIRGPADNPQFLIEWNENEGTSSWEPWENIENNPNFKNKALQIWRQYQDSTSSTVPSSVFDFDGSQIEVPAHHHSRKKSYSDSFGGGIKSSQVISQSINLTRSCRTKSSTFSRTLRNSNQYSKHNVQPITTVGNFADDNVDTSKISSGSNSDPSLNQISRRESDAESLSDGYAESTGGVKAKSSEINFEFPSPPSLPGIVGSKRDDMFRFAANPDAQRFESPQRQERHPTDQGCGIVDRPKFMTGKRKLDFNGFPECPVVLTMAELFQRIHSNSSGQEGLSVEDSASNKIPLLLRLNERYQAYFGVWIDNFIAGHTVLLHGFGSKMPLVQCFCNIPLLNRFNVLRVQVLCSHSGCSMKKIFDAILDNILTTSFSELSEQLNTDGTPESSQADAQQGWEQQGHQNSAALRKIIQAIQCRCINFNSLQERNPRLSSYAACISNLQKEKYQSYNHSRSPAFGGEHNTPELGLSKIPVHDYGNGVATQGQFDPSDPESIIVLSLLSMDNSCRQLDSEAVRETLAELASTKSYSISSAHPCRRLWTIISCDSVGGPMSVLGNTSCQRRFRCISYHTPTFVSCHAEFKAMVPHELAAEKELMAKPSSTLPPAVLEGMIRSQSRSSQMILRLLCTLQMGLDSKCHDHVTGDVNDFDDGEDQEESPISGVRAEKFIQVCIDRMYAMDRSTVQAYLKAYIDYRIIQSQRRTIQSSSSENTFAYTEVEMFRVMNVFAVQSILSKILGC